MKICFCKRFFSFCDIVAMSLQFCHRASEKVNVWKKCIKHKIKKTIKNTEIWFQDVQASVYILQENNFRPLHVTDFTGNYMHANIFLFFINISITFIDLYLFSYVWIEWIYMLNFKFYFKEILLSNNQIVIYEALCICSGAVPKVKYIFN